MAIQSTLRKIILSFQQLSLDMNANSDPAPLSVKGNLDGLFNKFQTAITSEIDSTDSVCNPVTYDLFTCTLSSPAYKNGSEPLVQLYCL